MRSKTPLVLIEQIIMVLVFALAAALCLWVFVWSDQASKQAEARDRASVVAQSVAETLKHAGQGGGDLDQVLAESASSLGGAYEAGGNDAGTESSADDGNSGSDGNDGSSNAVDADNATEPDALQEGGTLVIHYTSDWTPTADQPDSYVLSVTGVPTDLDDLTEATVVVAKADTNETLFEIPVAWQKKVA